MAARVYLDTNVFIRAFEGSDELTRTLIDLFAIDVPADTPGFATSELTLAELLVHPYRSGDHIERDRYDNLIRASHWLSVGPVDRQILIGAAVLRSKYSLKLPDAIHASTALHMGCHYLLTGDSGLKGSYSFHHAATGQQHWSGRSVQVVDLTLAAVATLVERLRS